MKIVDPAVRRAIATSNLGVKPLARQYGVTPSTIRNIIAVETGKKVLKTKRRLTAHPVIESKPCEIQALFEAMIRQRRQHATSENMVRR